MALKRLLAAAVLTLTLIAPARATTCDVVFPPGVFVTPACTWITTQVDPGLWKDNKGSLWVLNPNTGQPQRVAVFLAFGQFNTDTRP